MTQDERIVAVLSDEASIDILTNDDILEIKARVFDAIALKMEYVLSSSVH